MDKVAVGSAVRVLANTMRIYVEAQTRFPALFKVDREEAIDNVDRAFEAKLEALHTLHDLTRDEVRWFDFGDTQLLIAMRNAVHHRNHPLFRSLNSEIWLAPDPKKWLGAMFLLARHRIKGDPPAMMEHHFKLDDFRSRLDPDASSPHFDRFVKEVRARGRYELIVRDLGFPKIYAKAARERFPTKQVYLDVLPVFLSAVCRVFRSLDALGIIFEGFDAETYFKPFTSEIEVDLSSVLYRTPRFQWVGPTIGAKAE